MVKLERKLLVARAKLVLLTTLVRVLGLRLENLRVPTALAKGKVLRAIRATTKVVSISKAASMMGISTARYYAWLRADAGCELSDAPSCPKTRPTRMLFEEICAMHDRVVSKLYRHMSVRALAFAREISASS